MAVVAVTGASGFIGSAVVRALLAQGRSVRACVEPGAPLGNLEGLSVEVTTCDVTDARSIGRALGGAESLYHLAAVYKIWHRDPGLLHRVNVEGTVNTLLAAKRAGVRRVVYTSSIAAIGIAEHGLSDETTPWNLFDIANDYVLTKWQSDRIATRFAEDGLSLTLVNPAFPFGPGDRAPTPTGRIILAVLRGEVPARGPGGFCTIDVDDCAAGHLLAEERGRVGERYILGHENISLSDFIRLVARLGGVPSPRLYLPGAAGAAIGLGMQLYADHVSKREPPATYRSLRYAQRRAFFSSAKATRELGLPSRPLEETLTRAIAWFRETKMV